MPEQEALPLEVKPQVPPINKFIIPDDSVDMVSKPTPATPAAPEAAEPVAKTEQNTGEQATPDKPVVETPEKEEVTPEQAAKREGRRFERKLDKAYRQRAEAQAKAEQLEKRLAQLQQANAPKAPEGEPKLENFDYDPEKYATAKAEYAKTQATKEFEAKQRTDLQRQHQTRIVSEWETKAERGSEKYDDWDEKVGNLQPNSPISVAIMEAENGEDIAHYLGTHVKEAQRIAALSPLSQVREIGKLENKLLSKPVEPKLPSKAPAPVTPLSGSSSGAAKTLEEADMGEFIKMRQKQKYGKH